MPTSLNGHVSWLFLLVIAIYAQCANAQGKGGKGAPQASGSGGAKTCSSNTASLRGAVPASSTCQPWTTGGSYNYPSTIPNKFAHYTCPTSNKRILISNGIPQHWVRQANPNSGCELPWRVEMPLNPIKTSTLTEPNALGIVAMTPTGVPAYGAQEGTGGNAAEPAAGGITDAQYWYGHASPNRDWHYHSPLMGKENPASGELLAYALDGFPVYGPLPDSEVGTLDSCNGREDPVTGKYQYHARTVNQVDSSGDYCNGDSPAVAWNYVVGCYRGSLALADVSSCTNCEVPADCTLVDGNNQDQMSYFKGVTGSTQPSAPAPASPTPPPTAPPSAPPTEAPTKPPTQTPPAPAPPAPVPAPPTPAPQSGRSRPGVRGRVRLYGTMPWSSATQGAFRRVVGRKMRRWGGRVTAVRRWRARRSEEDTDPVIEFESEISNEVADKLSEAVAELRSYMASEDRRSGGFVRDMNQEAAANGVALRGCQVDEIKSQQGESDGKDGKDKMLVFILGAIGAVLVVAAIIGAAVWRRSRAKVASPSSPSEIPDMENARAAQPPTSLESVHSKDVNKEICVPHQISVKPFEARPPAYPVVTMGPVQPLEAYPPSYPVVMVDATPAREAPGAGIAKMV